MAMLELDATAIYVALPQMARSLGGTPAELQWVISVYALTLASLVLFFGSLADYWGHRRLLIVGLASFTVASLGAAMSANVGVLIASRVAQGIGGAMIFAVSPAILARTFRTAKSSYAFGLFAAAAGIAVALGPLVGGVLVQLAGWRFVFAANVPVGIIALLLAAIRLGESPGKRLSVFSWLKGSTVAVVIGMVALTGLFATSLPELALPTVVGLVALLAAVILFERTTNRTVGLLRRPSRERSFYGISAAALLGSATLSATMFLLVAYLQGVKNHSPASAGVQILPWTVAISVSSYVWSRFPNRRHTSMMLSISLAVISCGIAAGIVVDSQSSWLFMLPMMIVSGIGFGLMQPSRLLSATAGAGPTFVGKDTGLNQTFYLLGTVFGVSAISSFFQWRLYAESTERFASAVQPADLGLIVERISSGRFDPFSYQSGSVALTNFYEKANEIYLSALRGSLLLAAGFALAGAALAFVLIRSSAANAYGVGRREKDGG
ncbi:MFS transporter [Saccharomonospora sp. NPDC046836]|uniref:MFS transporter n=1 Tax=Saccharomonospora sp. NPDC046836 TaxID=3156921 RepID=UPI0033F72709